MSSADALFASGKEPGVEVWRIEDFKPVKQPAHSLGRFYTGDSYVVLSTRKLGGDKVDHEIFFWQGKESTQDETAASAILAEQLHASMGGRPQEHRELQGQESTAFQSLFKGGIRYQTGGAASGFHRHEEAPHKATLAQIKGMRVTGVLLSMESLNSGNVVILDSGRSATLWVHSNGVRVTEVPLSVDSLNSGDVFLLDLGSKIIVWAGSAATGMEKNKALTYTIALRDDKDHKGTAEVVHLDEDEKEGEDAAAFYSALGVQNPSSVSIKAASS